MGKVSVAEIKELMTATGVGMMDCKKALVEADGDMEKAVTPYGEVDIKVCELPDGGTKRYPEYESVKKLCETQNVSYMDVINSIKNI